MGSPALAFRRGQAVVLGILSALVVTAIVFAPTYEQAVGDALLRARVGTEATADASLLVRSRTPGNPEQAVAPNRLAALRPPSLAGPYPEPVLSRRIEVNAADGSLPAHIPMLWWSDQCGQVRLVSGRCPTAAGEIAVPESATGVAEGTRMVVLESDDAVTNLDSAPRLTGVVVGRFAPGVGDTAPAEARSGPFLLAAESTFTAAPGTSGAPDKAWQGVDNAAIFALDASAIRNRLPDLGRRTAAFLADPAKGSSAVTAASGLPAIATAYATELDQARFTIPLLLGQLALLLACVLWLVLVAGADQRRGEVAVARLRGRGVGGARRLLLRETLLPLLAGLPLGVLSGTLLAWFATKVLLPEGTPLPLLSLPRVALTLAVGGVFIAGLGVASVRRVSAEPVADLLRGIPPRRHGLALGTLEAMVVAGSGAIFVALAAGEVSGPVGAVAPVLLAVAAGIVLSRILPPVFAVLGRVLIRRGHLASGGGVAQSARRRVTVWLVPVVTVAVALVTFSVNAAAIADRNRTDRALADLGSAAVLTLATRDAAGAIKAVKSLDPRGDHATTVARISGPAAGATTTLAVDPGPFGRIAGFQEPLPGDARASLHRDYPAQILVRGRTLSLGFADVAIEPVVGAGDPALEKSAISFMVDLLTATGQTRTIDFGRIVADGVSRTVPCEKTCRLSGVSLVGPGGSFGTVHLSVEDLAVDGRPLLLPTEGTWAGEGQTAGQVVTTPDGLIVTMTFEGDATVSATHTSIPTEIPYVGTPTVAGEDHDAYAGTWLDRSPLSYTWAGTIPLVPGAPGRAVLVDQQALLIRGPQAGSGVTVSVWTDREDAASLDRLRSGLERAGFPVSDVRRARDVAHAFSLGAAAWGIALGTIVGGLAVAFAAIALLVLLETSRRPRSRDYAGLRLLGLPHRAAQRMVHLETLPSVLVSVLVGAGCGFVATLAAMPLVPLFAAPSPSYRVVVTPEWPLTLLAAGGAVLVLGLVAVLVGTRVVREATPDRLREVG